MTTPTDKETVESLISRIHSTVKGADSPNFIAMYVGDTKLILSLLDGRKALQQRITELEQEHQWHPIETAPKDGSEIWIIAGSAYSPKARVGWWQADGFYFLSRPAKFHGGGTTKMVSASHWQPLPPPPTEDV